MQTSLTISQAKSLYPQAELAVKFNVEHSNASVVVFQCGAKVVQVNSFPNGNQQAFSTNRSQFIDNYFQDLALEEDNFRVLKGTIEGVYNHR